MSEALELFRLTDSFAIAAKFGRAPQVPETFELVTQAEIKVETEHFPAFAVFLRIHTPAAAEQGIEFDVEWVGMFEPVAKAKPKPAHLTPYLNQRALYMLWVAASGFILQTTAQMGMAPVRLKMPYRFGAAVDIPKPRTTPRKRATKKEQG